MFVTTTIAMVYWTVFVQGITIKPLVKFLNVKVASEKDPTMNERIAGRFMDHVVACMEGILGELGNLRIRYLLSSTYLPYLAMKICIADRQVVCNQVLVSGTETNININSIYQFTSLFH